MKTMITAAILALGLGSLANASSPAIIKDAGSNPIYFGSTINEPNTATGPVLGNPTLFSNDNDKGDSK